MPANEWYGSIASAGALGSCSCCSGVVLEREACVEWNLGNLSDVEVDVTVVMELSMYRASQCYTQVVFALNILELPISQRARRQLLVCSGGETSSIELWS